MKAVKALYAFALFGLVFAATPLSAAADAVYRGDPAEGRGYQNARVEIFTTSWCPHCRRALAWLRENDVPFTEYDIEKDAAAKARQGEIFGSHGVPAAIINGKLFMGFSAEGYEAALQP
jgi:glutaredoxin